MRKKDYNASLVCLRYTSGFTVAFWCTDFADTDRGISWESLSDLTPGSYDFDKLRSNLADTGIVLAESPIRLSYDVSDIESSWVLRTYVGRDGFKGE